MASAWVAESALELFATVGVAFWRSSARREILGRFDVGRMRSTFLGVPVESLLRPHAGLPPLRSRRAPCATATLGPKHGLEPRGKNSKVGDLIASQGLSVGGLLSRLSERVAGCSVISDVRAP